MLAATDQAIVTRLDHHVAKGAAPVSILRRIAITAGACVLLAGCGGATGAPTPEGTAAAVPSPTAVATPSSTPSSTAGPTDAPTVTPTEAATPTPAAATGDFTLAASVWWSGFEIAPTGGTYDAVKKTLTIDAAFTNDGTQGSELRNLSDGTKIRWNGQDLAAFVSIGIVAPGATTQAQITAAVPAGFTVASAVLTFGASNQHQALVPLDGTAATSDRPTTLAITGKVTMGKYTTYTITSSMLVPASCSGYPDRIKYGPLDATLLSIVVFGTAVNRDSILDHHIDRGSLILADGSKVASVPVMGLELPANTTIRNQAMCFALDAPATGSYKVAMHEYRANATGTLAFQIP